jgi:arylsulfatase A-like enzyme
VHYSDRLAYANGLHEELTAVKPNVLLILSDEFRADSLGCAGHPLVQTPHLDGLAGEGTRFEHCFVQASPCAPSRMSIYTGRYLCSTGALDNMTPLAEPEDNLAMHLQGHGYRTAIMGYNDYAVDPRFLPEGHPHRTSLNYDHFLPGFETIYDHEYDSPEWFAYLREKGYPEDLCNHEKMYAPKAPPEGPGDHLPLHFPAHYRAEDSEAQFITSKAIDYLSGHCEGGCFLSLNYVKPHGPYLCPAPYHAMYDPKDVPPPIRRPDEQEDPHPYLARFLGNGPHQLTKDRDWRELRACYYGMISELDACLGRLFQAIKDLGQWDNTLIIFSADHGTYLGDHYLTGKPHYFDSALHVPLIVRDPSPGAERTRGTTLAPFCESIDLAPSICNFLGLSPHPRFQGKNLIGAVRGASAPARPDEIHYEFYYYNMLPETEGLNPEACRLWLLRDRRWKYVQFGEESLPPILFDLENDPNEFENLAERPEYAPIVAECCQRLIRWRIRNEDTRMEQWARPYR